MQSVRGEVEVDHGLARVFVAEQSLHDGQIGPVVNAGAARA
ncbi:MAG TPA: hypothetical protein VKB88_45630 [Bryobacteraceae bacterium]|nr:hypothetical protein [Bryobacteraceae bacterium]